MKARLRSFLNGFDFDLFDDDTLIGQMTWPFLAQAKNAKVRFIDNNTEGCIAVTLQGKPFLITFEHMRRGWTNDIRYEIVAKDLPGKPLAQTDVTHPPGWRSRPLVRQNLPFPMLMGSRRTLFQIHHALTLPDGTHVGSLGEPKRLSLLRTLDLTLHPGTDLPLPAQALLLYLAIQNA